MKRKIDNWSRKELKELTERSKTKKDLIVRLGYHPGGKNWEIVEYKLKIFGIPYSHLIVKQSNNQILRTDKEIFTKNSDVTRNVVRNHYKKGKYTRYECAICGQKPIWKGKKLTMILDHINGVSNDHRLKNLRWVCPNCNCQLPTFAGKNIKIKRFRKKSCYCKKCGKKLTSLHSRTKLCQKCYRKAIGKYIRGKTVKKPSYFELKKMFIKNNFNFSEIARVYGVSDSIIHRWCKKYGIPTRREELKTFWTKT